MICIENSKTKNVLIKRSPDIHTNKYVRIRTNRFCACPSCDSSTNDYSLYQRGAVWVEVQINKKVKIIERVVVQNNEIVVGTNRKTLPALRFM